MPSGKNRISYLGKFRIAWILGGIAALYVWLSLCRQKERAMPDDSNVAFHLEEYKIMKQQKYSLIDRLSTVSQYVLGGVAALYAWLLTHNLNVFWGIYIPFLLSLSGLAMALIIELRIISIDTYLKALECYLDRYARSIKITAPRRLLRPELEIEVTGWEEYREHSRSAGLWRWLIIVVFVALSLVTFFIPTFFPPSTKNYSIASIL
jgi:hypothetical protein